MEIAVDVSQVEAYRSEVRELGVDRRPLGPADVLSDVGQTHVVYPHLSADVVGAAYRVVVENAQGELANPGERGPTDSLVPLPPDASRVAPNGHGVGLLVLGELEVGERGERDLEAVSAVDHVLDPSRTHLEAVLVVVERVGTQPDEDPRPVLHPFLAVNVDLKGRIPRVVLFRVEQLAGRSLVTRLEIVVEQDQRLLALLEAGLIVHSGVEGRDVVRVFLGVLCGDAEVLSLKLLLRDGFALFVPHASRLPLATDDVERSYEHRAIGDVQVLEPDPRRLDDLPVHDATDGHGVAQRNAIEPPVRPLGRFLVGIVVLDEVCGVRQVDRQLPEPVVGVEVVVAVQVLGIQPVVVLRAVDPAVVVRVALVVVRVVIASRYRRSVVHAR